MNEDTAELTPANMIAMRSEPEALRAITARLRVKEMGPADHIRTKHEVKAWLEAGGDNPDTAGEIIRRARIRREEQSQRQVIAEHQRQEIRQSRANGQNGDSLM